MLENFSPLLFCVASLAVWRVTHLFYGEDGPGDVFVRLRRWAGDSFCGRLLDCFHCLSLWFAAPLAWWLGANGADRALLWFGLSGAAILLERVTTRELPAVPPAVWREDAPPAHSQPEENEHVLLR